MRALVGSTSEQQYARPEFVVVVRHLCPSHVHVLENYFLEPMARD